MNTNATFKTSFKNVDEYLVDVPSGSLITIGARPSIGKTAFAVNIAKNLGVNEKKNILMFSIEMKIEHLVMRLLSSSAEVSLEKLRCGRLSEQEWERLSEAQNTLDKANIYIEDSPTLTVENLNSQYQKMKGKLGNIDLIIIDYLQLMNDTVECNRVQSISNIMNGLKDFAKSNNVTVLIITQLSREIDIREDKRPVLSDLRESKSISELSDVVIFLYRDGIYSETQKDKDIAEINIAKNNFGKTGSANLEFMPEFYMFKDLQE